MSVVAVGKHLLVVGNAGLLRQTAAAGTLVETPRTLLTTPDSEVAHAVRFLQSMHVTHSRD